MVRAVSGNLTDVGLTRQENQDYFGDFEPAEHATELGRLLIVADGAGGHRGGKLAARMAVDVVAEAYYRSDLTNTSLEGKIPGIEEKLRSAFREANRRIHRKAMDDESLKGMACTCTALVLHRGKAYVGHLGDSRAYLVRGGEVRRLTRDHSIVQERVDAGLITPEEAKVHPERNIITKSLGYEPEIEPDLLSPPLPLAPGDVFVLSSDGLHGLLSDEEIAATVRRAEPIEACEKLVAAANARGGTDNITVQVVRIDEVG